MRRTLEPLVELSNRIADAADGDFLDFDVREVGHAVLRLVKDGLPVEQHPLGFLHAELTDALGATGRRIRLHLWTTASLDKQDDLGVHHAHTWTLASCVLVGSIRDISYRASESPEEEFAEIEIDYRHRVAQPTGRLYSLIVSRRIGVQPGFVYRLPDGVPHRTEVTAIPTVTLVVAEESGRQITSIFSTEPFIGTQSLTRPLISPELALREVRVAFDNGEEMPRS